MKNEEKSEIFHCREWKRYFGKGRGAKILYFGQIYTPEYTYFNNWVKGNLALVAILITEQDPRRRTRELQEHPATFALRQT